MSFILNNDGNALWCSIIGQILESNAFLSPKWGGFLFYNVPQYPKAGSTLPVRVDLDMRAIFQVFLAQLRLLIGLPDVAHKPGVHFMDSPLLSDQASPFLTLHGHVPQLLILLTAEKNTIFF